MSLVVKLFVSLIDRFIPLYLAYKNGQLEQMKRSIEIQDENRKEVQEIKQKIKTDEAYIKEVESYYAKKPVPK